MSMMVSSDNELEMKHFYNMTTTQPNVGVTVKTLFRSTRKDCTVRVKVFSVESNLKAGLSKRLVIPVQLICRVWKKNIQDFKSN